MRRVCTEVDLEEFSSILSENGSRLVMSPELWRAIAPQIRQSNHEQFELWRSRVALLDSVGDAISAVSPAESIDQASMRAGRAGAVTFDGVDEFGAAKWLVEGGSNEP